MATVKPVVFRLNEGYYGIDINKVIAIEQLGDVVPVPNAVDNVEGLINIRGDIIPVYNLKTKNKQKDEKSDEIRDYILVRCNESQIALSVDSVEDIQDETEYHKLPVICSDEENNYISGIVNRSGNLVIIVDVDKLLSVDELKVLDKLKD